MMNSENDPKPWFAQKRYGYGAGLPIAWQGWALLAAYLALLAGLGELLVPAQTALFILLVGFATGLLIWISARRTRGGWRWRWGERS
jgi:hypothetical protein